MGKSGYIINTPSTFADRAGQDAMMKAIEDLAVDVLIILSNDKLSVMLSKKYPGSLSLS